MRKQYKKKLRSCNLCKPHKTNWANRWKAKERTLAKQHDKEIKENS